VLFNLFTSCNSTTNYKNKTSLEEIDSVEIWLQQSTKKSFELDKRIIFLRKAYHQNDTSQNDSIKNRNLLKIAYNSYKLNDTGFFRKTNREATNLSIKLRDSLGIAETHWNEGMYYLDMEIMDSAYYHYFQAYKYFKGIKNEYNSGKMLYNMAIIQGRVKDYTGSEISSFQAISIFKKLKKPLFLYLCYNYLGIIYNDLQEYEKAIFYNNKALEYLENITQKGTYLETTLNNLGLVYQKQGNYKKAIEYFKNALKNNRLKTQDINHYARLIDNLAYTKFLSGDTTNVSHGFYKALHIRDSINSSLGVLINKLHLAEFYAAYTDTAKAVLYAKEANKLALNVNNNRDKLASLLLLSKLDKDNAKAYLSNYVSLSDSLQNQERKLRNKFTRIRFETDEYKEETEKLSRQKILISAAGLILVLILSLLYFIKAQHTKNKELIFEKEQQKANEEIYSLMLKQQFKMEEGRLKERHRIAEDLHDGVLGKIFGTRLGLGFLDIKGDNETLEKHTFFIDELQHIEKEIRTISHELKNEIFTSKLNFITIVESLIKSQSNISNFKYTIFSDDIIYWNEVDEKIKINCYRIIQEALQNINKYAKASLVNVDFNLTDNILKLVIKDNGIGFDTKIKKKGIGLKNIQSRTQKIRGRFTINSKINKGTILTFLIPL
jgi:two-component system, NarL family, sensor kinase